MKEQYILMTVAMLYMRIILVSQEVINFKG